MYSANCKEDCKLKDTIPTVHTWLSSSDHCEWSRVKCNINNEIIELKLREKGLSQSFTLFELDRLEFLNLNVNNLSGDFTVAGGDPFKMRKLRKLAVSRNKLTGMKGLQLLKKVTNLQLRNNTMGEEFVITTTNFPKTVRRLNLKSNGLKIITGLQFLQNLRGLNLSDNEFSGAFTITIDNFPSSLKKLSLNRNVRVTSINVEDGAVPNLCKLIIDAISASNGLCDRGISIEPPDICPCKKVVSYTSNGSALDNIIESFVQNQNFSSYCQDDFDIVKEWFLNTTNHPKDGKQDSEIYMKVRVFIFLSSSLPLK